MLLITSTLIFFKWIIFKADSITDSMITIQKIFQFNKAVINLTFNQVLLIPALASLIFPGIKFWFRNPKYIYVYSKATERVNQKQSTLCGHLFAFYERR